MKNPHTNYQKSYTSNDNYMDSFQNLVQVADHIEGNFGEHPGLVKCYFKQRSITSPSDDERKAGRSASKEAYLAMAFLSGLNKEK